MFAAVKAPIDRLIEFIERRCDELGIPQNELARRADMDPGSLGNITTRRVKAPSHPTLKKLAKGLSSPRWTITASDLTRLLEGEELNPPDTGSQHATESKPAEPGRMLALIDDMGNLAHPLTKQEREIIERADRMRMSFDTFLMPGFWNRTPDERRRLFRDLENVMDEMADLMGEMG